jgi:hypothetical protein
MKSAIVIIISNLLLAGMGSFLFFYLFLVGGDELSLRYWKHYILVFSMIGLPILNVILFFQKGKPSEDSLLKLWIKSKKKKLRDELKD